MSEELQSIVIDNGTGFTKAGFGGEDAPRIVFPTVVGRPKNNLEIIQEKDCYIGEEIRLKMDLLDLKYPMENGFIKNWDDMEKLWFHTFYNEIKVEPEEFSVLLSETPLNPRSSREKTIQIMFESFSIAGFHTSFQSLLSLYTAGKTTGLVFESGDGCSYSSCIYDGYDLYHSIIRSDLSGRDLTEYLIKLLNEKGHYFKNLKDEEMIRDLKEKTCYIALDYDQELKKLKESKGIEKLYQLPDGNFVNIEEERFKCTESLFQPSLIQLEDDGIHKMMHKSIGKCDKEIQELFSSNIVISGGNTMFQGFEKRLQKEMENLSSQKIEIISSPERKYNSWIGGSIFTTLKNFIDVMVIKEQYDECGPSVLRKCLAWN